MEPVTLNSIETGMVHRYNHDATRILLNMYTIVAKLIGWPEEEPLEHLGLLINDGALVVVFDSRTHEIVDGEVRPILRYVAE